MWILFAVGIGAIAVVVFGMVVFVLLRNARVAEGPAMYSKYPRGHWMSVGMLFGISIGAIPSLVSVLLDRMSPWAGIAPALGLAFGVAIGSALESRHKDELRPLTEAEQQVRFRTTLVVLGALALLVLSLFMLDGIGLFTSR